MKVTPEDITRIEQRAAKATPGEWPVKVEASREDYDGEYPEGIAWIPAAHTVEDADGDHNMSIDNAAFIAAARTDVPALCAALREAWEERDEAERQRNRLHRECGLFHGVHEQLQRSRNDKARARCAKLEETGAGVIAAVDLQMNQSEPFAEYIKTHPSISEPLTALVVALAALDKGEG